MSQEEALNELIQQLHNEQDELTLQKNYLSEAEQILVASSLQENYEALINCMQNYPAYLFKKEKEFIFFVTRLNALLGIYSDKITDFSDPSIYVYIDQFKLKLSFYYTVQGICEINFDYQGVDAAIQLNFDAINHQLDIVSKDVLHLSMDAAVKSAIIHYIADIVEQLRQINISVHYETTTAIDPFLTFTKFEFERAPRLDDSDLDKLFISMDGKGDMRYTDNHHGVILTLDEDNTVWINTTPGSLTSSVTMENNKQDIYLFDLLGENPFLEQLFTGEIRIKKGSDHIEADESLNESSDMPNQNEEEIQSIDISYTEDE